MRTFLGLCTLAVVIAGLLSSSFAQPPDTLWSRTFGGAEYDGAMCVRQTWDGGYIAAGYTQSFGAGGDAWLIRLNAQGDSVWSRTYGGPLEDVVYSVLQTADSGFVLAGYALFATDSMAGLLIRTNSQGDTLWTRRFVRNSRDRLMSVQPTQDGGYILAGYSRSLAYPACDGWLIRTNAAGDTLWTRTFGGTGDDHFYEARQTLDGGYVAAGYRDSYRCFWLVKTDGNGDSVWSRTFCASSGVAEAHSVQQTADSGYILAGCAPIRSTGTFDFWLIRTDANGDSLWSRAFGGPDDNLAYSVRSTRDGGFVVAGGTGYYEPSGIRVIKTDAAGDSLWGLAFDDMEGHARCVEPTADGGYILAGCVAPAGTDRTDFWLARIGPDPSPVEDGFSLHPSSFILSVFPNPFNPVTEIAYDLAKAGRVSLRVFDLLGREVAVLKDGFAEAGSHHVTFDGSGLASGIYFARLDAGKFSQTKKLMLLR